MRKFLQSIALILLFIPVSSTAQAFDNEFKTLLRDSLYTQLTRVHTSKDSIPVLQDIYDLTFGPKRVGIAENLYRTASNAGDDHVRIEALKYIANLYYNNDSVLQAVYDELGKIKSSPERKNARLFTNLMRIDNMLVSDPSAKQLERLQEFNRRFNSNPPEDPHDKIALLYALCRYMGTGTNGELLKEYVDKLENMVDALNMPDGAVKRLIYNRVARLYLNGESYREAIESDQKLLNAIDTLEMQYAEQGRHFANAPIYRYNSYRRMLASYPVLSDTEIEEYYNKCQELAASNEYIASDMKYDARPSIYYSMAKGDYANAQKLVEKYLKRHPSDGNSLQMYRMLHEAALNNGDRQTTHESAEELFGLLEDHYRNKKLESAKELKLVYDINELKYASANDEIARNQQSLRTRSIIIALTCALVLLLGLIIGMLIYQDRKHRRMTEMLKRKNASLRKERDDLEKTRAELMTVSEKAKKADRIKTDFIHNMSHEVTTPLKTISEYTQLIVDCIPEEKSRYLDRFAVTIHKNVEMVLNLVNEVLDIAASDHNNFNIVTQPSDVMAICNLAVSNIFDPQSQNDKVKFVFDKSSKTPLVVDTDSQRVSQVLINLLGNAEKFTESGTITLDYNMSEDGKTLVFSVSDTGIGIPRGQEEAIFERFRQLDPTTPGYGLGLYVSRMIANHLGGTVTVDKSYKGGARFLFTIPI